MRSTVKPVNSLQEILAIEAKIAEAKSKQKVKDDGAQRGISNARATELRKKLQRDQLELLEAYVVANYNFRYRRAPKMRIADVSAKWNQFLANLTDEKDKQAFNKIREEYDSYQNKIKNLNPTFALEVKTFGLSNDIKLEEKQKAKPVLVQAPVATAQVQAVQIPAQPVLVQAPVATAKVSSGLQVQATAVPTIKTETENESFTFYKAAKSVADAVKNLFSNRRAIAKAEPAQVAAKPVLAQAPVATAKVSSGLQVKATPVVSKPVKEVKPSDLYAPATNVANAVKDVLSTKKVDVTPAPIKPAVETTAAVKKAQEDTDKQYAMQLQKEFDRESQSENDDHLLAIKLQIEEEVKEEIVFPSKDKLHLQTAEEVAGDVYSRGLANLGLNVSEYERRKQQRTGSAKAPRELNVKQAASYINEAYFIGVFAQTASIQFTIVMTDVVIQSAIEIQAAERSKRQGMYAYARQFSMFSVTASQTNIAIAAIEVDGPRHPRSRRS